MPQFLFAPRVNSFDNEETVMGTYTGVQWQNAVTVPTMELVFFCFFFLHYFSESRRPDLDRKMQLLHFLLHNSICGCFLIAFTTIYTHIAGFYSPYRKVVSEF